MFRREMGSKRGCLPPKEGDLTCMLTVTASQSKGREWINYNLSIVYQI